MTTRRASRLFAPLILAAFTAFAQADAQLPGCEWCGAGDAPDSLGWRTAIAADDEPGTKIVVRGRVLKSDGKTPVPGVLLYAYQTSLKGIYEKTGTETGNGRRHGRLRAWVRTDSLGRYEFLTIRPGGYPSSTAPAHIHMTVTVPGREEYWINDVTFSDDPRLTDRDRRGNPDRGGPGVVTLGAEESGRKVALRDIVLPW